MVSTSRGRAGEVSSAARSSSGMSRLGSPGISSSSVRASSRSLSGMTISRVSRSSVDPVQLAVGRGQATDRLGEHHQRAPGLVGRQDQQRRRQRYAFAVALEAAGQLGAAGGRRQPQRQVPGPAVIPGERASVAQPPPVPGAESARRRQVTEDRLMQPLRQPKPLDPTVLLLAASSAALPGLGRRGQGGDDRQLARGFERRALGQQKCAQTRQARYPCA